MSKETIGWCILAGVILAVDLVFAAAVIHLIVRYW